MSRKSVKLTGFLSLRTSPMPNSVTASLKKEKKMKEEAPYSDTDAGPLPPKPKVTDAEKKNTPGRKKFHASNSANLPSHRASHRDSAKPLRREKRKKKCSPPAPPFPMLCVVGLAIANFFFPENFGLCSWHNTSFPDRWPYAACLQVRR